MGANYNLSSCYDIPCHSERMRRIRIPLEMSLLRCPAMSATTSVLTFADRAPFAILGVLVGGKAPPHPPIAAPATLALGSATGSGQARAHSLRSLHPPQAALPSLPTPVCELARNDNESCRGR